MNEGQVNEGKAVEDFDIVQKDYEQNKEDVLNMLFANITNVNIEIPRVVKGDFTEDQ